MFESSLTSGVRYVHEIYKLPFISSLLRELWLHTERFLPFVAGMELTFNISSDVLWSFKLEARIPLHSCGLSHHI